MPLIITPGQFSQRADFYHQLAQLTAAGIGVTHALEQLMRHPPAHSYRKPIEHFLAELAKGKTLSESLRHADWLPDFDLTLIEAGERSGRLDQCFRALAEYYNQRASLAKQIISQMLYPAFLVHFAVLIFIVVLPYAFSGFSKSFFLLFGEAALILSPIYIVTALVIYASQSKHGENWRAFMEKFLNRVPILGSARRSLALSRLTLALEALISAGVTIIEAWDMAAKVSGSVKLRDTVAGWKPRFADGLTPAALLHSSPIFPETFVNLYSSGEVSGKLDETLRRLHAFYQEDSTYKLNLISQWTPKIIYLVVALVIAYEIIQAWNHIYGPNSDLAHIINGQ